MSLVEPARSTNPTWLNRRRLAVASAEILLTSTVLLVYFVVRGGARPEQFDASVTRGLAIVRFEQSIGLFQERWLQSVFLNYDGLMWFANLVYAWGHFPVLAIIGIWLALKDVGRFRFMRNVMLLSAILGVACYYLIPTAPPRLLAAHGFDFGFVDTVHVAGSNANYFKPGPFVNDYAALPSFHFGWIALASAAIWVNTTSRWARAVAVALSVIMLWSITVTANHFFFDTLMGGVIVAISWAAVSWFHAQPLSQRFARLLEWVRRPLSPATD